MLLGGRQARIYNFLDFDAVSALIQQHLSGAQNRRLLIWSLLSFEQWLLTFEPAA
jgi:asparagine synthase (glutamine-hydrolysing)